MPNSAAECRRALSQATAEWLPATPRQARGFTDMCGIAGYSLSAPSERRADARGAGAARRDRRARRRRRRVRIPTGPSPVDVHKQRSGASALLEEIELPREHDRRSWSTCATTRRATRGSRRTTTRSATAPSSASTTGSSSTTRSCSTGTASSARAPEMTVDSEAIFALVDESDQSGAARLERAARLDGHRLARRAPRGLALRRARRRPPALARRRAATSCFFASTKATLEVVERYLGLKLRSASCPRGRLVEL